MAHSVSREIDPNVSVPPAVKAAAAAAERLHKEVYAQPEEPDPTEQPAEEAPKEEVNPDLRMDATTPAPVEQPAEEKVTPKVTDKVTDEVNWEHRYNSMKGRFDRAQEQIASMSEQIASMQRAMATMRAQSAPPVEIASDEPEVELTSEELYDYGDEFLSVVGKKARAEVRPLLKAYEQKIASLEARLAGVGDYVQQDSFSRMQSALDNSVPDWRKQNENPEFLAWLALPDPYSGDIRHNMLKAAWERRDAPRVAAFFKGFLAEEAATSPASPAPAPEAGKPSLEKFAAPGRAKTAASDSSAPAEKPIITTAQIAKFYADVAAGRYRGREEAKDKFDRAIFEAQREGRIR